MRWFRVGGDRRCDRHVEGLLVDGDARHVRGGTDPFGIDNDGPSVHEFVVLRTDDAPDALPVENGVIPEDQIDLIDEVDDLAPGTSSSLDVNLDAGAYVLVCNLPAHYEQGMFAAFTVA